MQWKWIKRHEEKKLSLLITHLMQYNKKSTYSIFMTIGSQLPESATNWKKNTQVIENEQATL